jgi:hypothetical protein
VSIDPKALFDFIASLGVRWDFSREVEQEEGHSDWDMLAAAIGPTGKAVCGKEAFKILRARLPDADLAWAEEKGDYYVFVPNPIAPPPPDADAEVY